LAIHGSILSSRFINNDENQQHYETYNFIFFKAQLQIEIQSVALKITSWRSMGKKENFKKPKSNDVWVK
jgi:hypothetical protein